MVSFVARRFGRAAGLAGHVALAVDPVQQALGPQRVGDGEASPRVQAKCTALSLPWVRIPPPLARRGRIPVRASGASRFPNLPRRGWDSNPRVPKDNALAGRRFKPLSHPSKQVAPLGLEPRLSGARIRRVASYTTGQENQGVSWTQSHQSDLNRRPRHYE